MKFGTFFAKKAAPKNNYLGLFLKETEVLGFIFEIVNGKVSILAKDTQKYTNGWDTVLEDTDELLMRLEAMTKVQCEKVIFFVYSYFIEEHAREIKKQYRDIIKNLLKHLDLKPLGYIECYEAVAEHLHGRDKTPLNAVLLELDKTYLGVFVFKGGKKIFSKSIPRTGDIITDLSGVFEQMGEVMLPSRLILYDSIDVSRESHTILTHQWDSSLFVQHPRTEIVSEEDLHAGLAHIFGNQLASDSDHEASPVTSAADDQLPYHEDLPPQEVAAAKEVMGFAIGADVAQMAMPVATHHHETPVVQPPPPSPKRKFSLPFKLPDLSFIKIPKVPLKFAWIPVVVLLLIVIGVIEYFFHTAVYEVYMPSKSLQKEVTLQAPINSETEKLQITTSTASAEFTETTPATGVHEVGEKAKGNITFNNFDDGERVIPKGTALTANNVNFILDQEVKIASSSVVNNDTKVAGKASGSVTAANIGTEGNIAKGAKLSVADISTSTVFALADNTFTGGSKKEVKTVSKKDYDGILKTIMDKAKATGNGQTTSLSGDEKLLTSLTQVTARDLRYNKEVGEEATDLTLKANIDTTYFIYHDTALKDTLITEFSDEVPEGYSIDPNKITYTGKSVDRKDDRVSLDVEAQAMAILRASPSEILKRIVGKGQSSVEDVLKNEFKADGFDAQINSPLFFFAHTAPFFQKNIKVKVTSR